MKKVEQIKKAWYSGDEEIWQFSLADCTRDEVMAIVQELNSGSDWVETYDLQQALITVIDWL